MIHKIRENLKKGSALVFALIILAMLLAIAIAIANVSTRERKLAGVSKASTQAFQVADSGAEIVLRNLESLEINDPLSSPAVGCSGKQVAGNAAGGSYTVSFLDWDRKELECTSAKRYVYGLKAVGSYSGTVRAIQTAVAAFSRDNGNHCDNIIMDSVYASTGVLLYASDECIDYDDGTNEDWYLPSADELTCFIGATTDNTLLWTRTPGPDANTYYRINLSNGNTEITDRNTAGGAFRCIR